MEVYAGPVPAIASIKTHLRNLKKWSGSFEVAMTETTSITAHSALTFRDYMGMFMMRLGLGRSEYKVAPGLYNIGKPDRASPVFVSANYKMSFDVLRKELSGTNAWILVLDTRGVNVWCAAGKRTFSTDEVVRMIEGAGLSRVVDHRELILPQLSAPGVSAHEVKKRSGFKVVFGPVRARDIKRFMDNGKNADVAMRTVTFTAWERFVLIPLEITSRITTSLYVIAAIFAMSAIGHYFFAFENARAMAFFGVSAYFIGLLSGGILTPLFLYRLPGRGFSIKGAFMGFVSASVFCLFFHKQLANLTLAAILLFATSVSSYVALTFTGATPFTSPTGVEKEMRRALPLQLIAAILFFVLWLTAAFMGGAS